jgi:four helix bundle protein
MSEHGFKQLAVWQRSKKLAVDTYKITVEGPVSRDYGLIDQMRRSAVSVPSNIAEGDERDSDKDSARFFEIAKGSLGELATQVEIAVDVGYLKADRAAALSRECLEIGKMLGGLIKARRRSVPKLMALLVGITIGVVATHLL